MLFFIQLQNKHGEDVALFMVPESLSSDTTHSIFADAFSKHKDADDPLTSVCEGLAEHDIYRIFTDTITTDKL